MKKNI
jgi:hypothetical protein